jgi:hypothetical protein
MDDRRPQREWHGAGARQRLVRGWRISRLKASGVMSSAAAAGVEAVDSGRLVCAEFEVEVRTPAQVMVHSGIQRGRSVIPKSTKLERIAESIDILGLLSPVQLAST